MKLVFKKDEEHQINVFHEVDGKQQDFSYVDMIKSLIESRELEKPDISDGFTDPEINSIKRMVSLINEEISTTEEADKPYSS